jgi:uncharacterized protein (TIRG00374 family)
MARPQASNSERPSPQKARPRLGRLRSIIILVLVGLGIHILMPQIATFGHSLEVLRSMSLWALGLAILAQFLSYVGSGYLMRGIGLATGRGVSILRGTAITAASNSVGLVAGGVIGMSGATYRWMRADGVTPESAIQAGWLPGILEDLLLLALALIGLFFLLFIHALTKLEAVTFVLILAFLVLLIGAILYTVRSRSWLMNVVAWFGRRWAALRRRPADTSHLRDVLNRHLDALQILIAGGWRPPVLGASLAILFDMLCLFLLFVAAGHAVNPGVLLVGYGLPLLIGKAPLLPGGVGIVEGTMVALYDGLGVPDAVAVVVVLSYRFLSFWLPLMLGFPLIVFLDRGAARNSSEAAK